MSIYVIYLIVGLLFIVLLAGIISLFIIALKERNSNRIVYNKFACHNNGASMDDEEIQVVKYDSIGML